ncbi:hypothetical protein O181_012332 [Austropuccinia psidii MF-1]|uniref:Uncharacterized protein n=1 Tax=Austropuccinia psidii MF-1 TaxID=1389203 RepID=A0A9Q3GMY2_9BASI|nr:hypothetical protein [Austropuccinia psidii MF-1]
MKPDFKKGDQVLVSTLNFNNLKGPRKLRYSIVGPFTIIKLIRKNAVKVKLTEAFSRKHPVFPKNPAPPEIVEGEGSPGPVKRMIKARKIGINCKDQRQYLVRLKSQTEDKDIWLAKDAIPDRNLHLRRSRASRRTEQSHH